MHHALSDAKRGAGADRPSPLETEKVMKFNRRTLAATLTASSALGLAGPAWADGGDVAVGLMGGMMMSHAINEGRQQQSYQSGYSAGAQSSQPRTVYVERRPAAPAAPAAPTAEQRIGELNRLRSKGLITDSEYAARKKAILDSL